jgi:hypothetical protein
MKEEKLGKEPAFAAANDGGCQPGMSKRFYAACRMLQSLSSAALIHDKVKDTYKAKAEKNGTKIYQEIVKNAYDLADELLKQE